MNKNKLIIAAAGSGKTTFIVNRALELSDKKSLITTYTEANELEIKNKLIKQKGCIPEHLTIQSWFSFLIQHGVKPYQSYLFDKKINGLILVNMQSGFKYKAKNGNPVYYSEADDLQKYYFSKETKIYSDKLSKFVFKCNEKSSGKVVERICKLYSNIFIDESQDLAGYDLSIIKHLFESPSSILLVGDPRQVTYLTHIERKYEKYKYGLIDEFIRNECKHTECEIDDETLSKSYRNNQLICSFSAKLYPSRKECTSEQHEITGHDGIFLVKKDYVQEYLNEFNPVQLRLNIKDKVFNDNLPVYNFGASKGLTFKRVIIYPTKDMLDWVKDNEIRLKNQTRAKFYVAITRAKFSVGIICDNYDDFIMDGIDKYKK